MFRRPLLVALLLVSGCAASPAPAEAPQAPLAAALTTATPLRWKAVTVAGDASLPVFDNATRAVAERLTAAGALAAPGAVRLSASAQPQERQRDERPATRANVVAAIEAMLPSEGEGCFVFLTSHGDERRGLLLARNETLTPAALDAALTRGCGAAPTVAIVSGCYTGGFTRPPMARPNRVVLSAARADRPSFGCGAGFTYTVYDECLLAVLGEAPGWAAAHEAIRACVARKETEQGFGASEPQAFFGAETGALAPPGRPSQR